MNFFQPDVVGPGGELEDELRQIQQRRREDHRDDAGLVDLERQIRRRSAVHLAAHHALGVLHRDAALALLNEHDTGDDDEGGHAHERECECAALVEDGFALGGMRAEIPAKISSDMPLPTPRSVMSSPIHMTTQAPAVMTSTTIVSANTDSSLSTSPFAAVGQSWPREARATMPVDCSNASATVR